LGQYLESESIDFCEWQVNVVVMEWVLMLSWTQNREYAVSQLSDLHQKLAKAQTSVTSTRAPPPSLPKDKEDKLGLTLKVTIHLMVFHILHNIVIVEG
jgi:hypothetical protein